MKKLYFILVFSLLVGTAKSQHYTFFTIGYNAGLSGSRMAIDTFVSNYNSIRPWLTQKMNNQGYIRGFTTSWGLGSNSVFLDIMFSNKYSQHTAMGPPTPSSPLVRRDVRFTFNAMSFCLYYVNPNKKNFRGPGISLDIGKIRQRTRSGDAGTIETQKYSDIGVSSSIGVTLCYNYKIKIVKGVFIGLRPYIQYLHSDADIYVTAQNINKGFTGTKSSLDGLNLGLQLNLAFGTYHYNY